MNVQRLIEKYKKLEGVWDAEGAELARQIFLEDLKQLDEQKPVKVPQCVADWIEEARKACKDVVDFFEFNFTNDEVGKWFMQELPFDLAARAWLDGYEVEEEKRYTVVTKATKQPLYYNAMDKKLFFSMGGLATKFTRKQLEEAGLGWVFDCEGIEIEEVEYDTNA
ncbi:phage protein [Streptococcus pneumoniae]|nr:phage protein [Streptococcus pneumoniae]VLJ79043.1 phage protein [Streptococcus pneumoniae]VNC48047.1 phage protein [Streptococcus pneumoniae]VNV24233.1 phage protein [Streptococcus pneumoniae]VOP21509.1 phage protein [Streptococcus pneumoniae]